MRALMVLMFSVVASTAWAGAPVSLAELAGFRVLVADYDRLTVVDLASSAATEVKPVAFEGTWNPTGVARLGGTVAVANYTGRNVLVGRVSDAGFVIEHVLTDPLMRAPENVALSADGIAVADYDGSAILFFGWDCRLKWRTPVPLAHGVEIAGGRVYGTSLAGNGVVALAIADGSLVAQIRQGWLYRPKSPGPRTVI